MGTSSFPLILGVDCPAHATLMHIHYWKVPLAIQWIQRKHSQYCKQEKYLTEYILEISSFRKEMIILLFWALFLLKMTNNSGLIVVFLVLVWRIIFENRCRRNRMSSESDDTIYYCAGISWTWDYEECHMYLGAGMSLGLLLLLAVWQAELGACLHHTRFMISADLAACCCMQLTIHSK
jgi:hypothetical protein